MLLLTVHIGQCYEGPGSLASSQEANAPHASAFHLFVSTIGLLHNVAHSHGLQLIHAFVMCLAPWSGTYSPEQPVV